MATTAVIRSVTLGIVHHVRRKSFKVGNPVKFNTFIIQNVSVNKVKKKFHVILEMSMIIHVANPVMACTTVESINALTGTEVF